MVTLPLGSILPRIRRFVNIGWAREHLHLGTSSRPGSYTARAKPSQKGLWNSRFSDDHHGRLVLGGGRYEVNARGWQGNDVQQIRLFGLEHLAKVRVPSIDGSLSAKSLESLLV